MSFFSFIETFFFLSLGITFVLVLLLVYHFKQRLTTLENKCDTVFEIISNVVKEMNNIKQSHQVNHYTDIPNMGNMNTFIPSFTMMNDLNGKIKVSDEDFEEENEYENVDGEGQEEDSDESDGDDSDEDGDSDEESEDYDDMPPLISVDDDDVTSSIKIINVEIGDNIEADIIETELEPENIETGIDEMDKSEPIELIEEEKIHVEKLEETSTLENTNSEVSNVSSETSKDIYSKMSVSELKALVITKGLSSDPSKKKKHELVKLLEVGEN